MKTIKNLSFFLLGIFFLAGCSSDDTEYIPKGKYETGFFVVNEGPFQNGSGNITHIAIDGTVSQKIFKEVNNEDLGNIVQSMAFANGKAYIVVNNSDKIVVANRYTFKKEGEITEGIRQPRYAVTYGKKAYVSNWGDPTNPDDDFIAVIDLESDAVVKSIPVGEGPEKMLVVNNKVYVTLKGGWGINDKVVIINPNSDEVLETIKVDFIPNSIAADFRGNVWVLCSGRPAWMGAESAGSLAQINAINDELVSILPFPESSMHPQHLTIDGNILYYHLNQNVYMMATVEGVLPTEPIPNIQGNFYSMRAFGGFLYTTDAKDYNSEGELRIYDPNTGTVQFQTSTGIVPTQVVFQNEY